MRHRISVPHTQTGEHKNAGRGMLVSQFFRTFSQRCGLSGAELNELFNGERQPIAYEAGKIIAPEGAPALPRIVLAGWACEQRILEDGERQIFSFITPGDFLGFDAATARIPANIVTLTPTVILNAGRFRDTIYNSGRYATTAGLLHAQSADRVTFLYDQIQRLGCQSAYDRLSDLLSELFRRLSLAGHLLNGSVPFPLTQEALADALGLSTVHVNRTLQQMRRDGTLILSDGRLTLHRTKPLRPYPSAPIATNADA